MPILRKPPRQETTVGTTRTLNLVEIGAPLHQKPFTTFFNLSFPPLNLKFLQFLTKTLNFLHFNPSNPGSQSSTLRPYVLFLQCKPRQLPLEWNSCERPFTDRCFLISSFWGRYILLHLFMPSNPRFQSSCILDDSELLKSDPRPLTTRSYGTPVLGLFLQFRAPKSQVPRSPRSPLKSAIYILGSVVRGPNSGRGL